MSHSLALAELGAVISFFRSPFFHLLKVSFINDFRVMFSKPILSRGQSSFLATLSFSLYPILTRTGYGLRKHRWHFPSRSQVRNDNKFSISWHRRNKRGHSSNSKYIPLPELSYRVYISGFIQRWRCQNGKLWKQHSTSNLFILFSFLFPFHLPWPYHII